MAKDPAVLFYTSDFVTGTAFFTMEERGIYITLLCMQHQQGGICEKDMINICRTYESRVFQKFTKNEDGLYYNERMKAETEKRRMYSQSRSNNRKSNAGDPKKPKKTTTSYVPHMENENENTFLSINTDNNNTIIDEIDKFSYMCMNDELHFVAPIGQKLNNTEFERELLPEYFIEFNNHLRLTADTEKSYQDYRRHFINWITGKMQTAFAQPASKNTDPQGMPIDRRKHPKFPSDYPYNLTNIYYYEKGLTEKMAK